MTEMYQKFKIEILATGNNQTEDTVDSLLFKKSLSAVRAAAILVICINTYHLLRNLFNGFYDSVFWQPGFAAEIFSIVTSAFIITVTSLNCLKNKFLFLRISLLFYYLSITLMMALLSYGIYTIYPDYMGIPLSSLFFFMFMIFPLQKLFDSIIVLASMFLELSVVFFVSAEPNLFIHLLMRIVIVLGYFYFRREHRKAAENQMNIINLNQVLERFSYVDKLTNVLNRYALEKYEQILFLEKTPNISAIMLDVDDFKCYNDYYSHDAGDNVLAQICGALAGCLGESDPYIFRFGGEEFLIFVKDLSGEEVLALAQKYRKVIYDLNIPRADIEGVDRVTISLGVSIQVESGNYMIAVDRQLYKAKGQGKNCVFFNNTLYR